MNRKEGRGRVLSSGSFSIRLNHTNSGWRIIYYMNGRRVFERAKDEKGAESRARDLLENWNRGVPPSIDLRPQDYLRLQRTRDMLRPFKVEIDEVAEQFVDASHILGSISLVEAARFYRGFYPERQENRTVEEVVNEFLTHLMDGSSQIYIKDMRARLGQLTHSFSCSLNQLTPDKLQLFFDQFRSKSPRTFNNFRRAVGTFLNYCKKKDYLPEDVDLLRKIEVRKERIQDVAIYSPEELALMLGNAPQKLIPVIVLGGFCGLRTSEIMRLEWDAINWKERYIGVRGRISKTGHNRLAPLCESALSWLSPYMRLEGKVWPESTSVLNRALKALAEETKIKGGWRRNGLRHSFCSYRLALTQNIQQTSIEAGNSPNILRKNYLSVVSMSKAKAWFGVKPQEIENVVMEIVYDKSK